MYAAAPSQPLEGVVRDAKTDTPIAGVPNPPERLSGIRSYMGDILTTDADEQGRYRLEGMPKGEGNRVLAIPTDQPYFMQEFAVPGGAGSEPVKFDLRLRRGMWVEGRVTDKSTGEPVRANMSYIPWPDNPQAEGLRRQFALHSDQFSTDRDGHFRIVGGVGHGLVAARCIDRPFPGVQGVREIADLPTDNEFRTVAAYAPTSPGIATAIREVRIDENAKSVTADIRLDPGSRVTIHAVDLAGQPLSGLTIRGVTPRGFHMDGGPTGPTAEIIALSSDEKRVVALYHKEHNLGKVIRVGVEDAKNGPITVVLQPCATLTGRLLDTNGDPLRGEVEFSLDDQNFGLRLPEVMTDMQGRFTNNSMLPGGEYGVSIGFNRIADNLAVAPGETIDLGEFDVTSKTRPEPIRKQAASEEMKSTVTAPTRTTENGPMPTAQDETHRIIHGRVIGADGNPAAHADLAIIGVRADHERGGDLGPYRIVLAETTADADGKYEMALAGVSSKTHREAQFIARASSSAVAWQSLNLDADDSNVSFQLTAEETIGGKFVDIEGQPAAGVRFSIASIRPRAIGELWPTGGVGLYDLKQFPLAWPQAKVSDDRGHFTIGGIPKNCGVFLQIEPSENFAPQSIALNTGMPEQRGERDGTYRPQVVKNLQPGEAAVLPLAPEQLFTGTVRFDDSGESAPHRRD